MVPGNLPSQLEILSTGQNYYETTFHKAGLCLLKSGNANASAYIYYQLGTDRADSTLLLVHSNWHCHACATYTSYRKDRNTPATVEYQRHSL